VVTSINSLDVEIQARVGKATTVRVTPFRSVEQLGEVRDQWNTGTEETFKLLPSWWPYSLVMWLWILYLRTTVWSI